MTALLLVDEAARLLNLPVATVNELVAKKEIGYVTIGEALRFNEADLRVFIAKHTTLPVIGQK